MSRLPATILRTAEAIGLTPDAIVSFTREERRRMAAGVEPPWGSILPSTGVRMDMNLDGRFTISDVELWLPILWDWLGWLYFLPGNLVIWAVLTILPEIGLFLEWTTSSYNGAASGLMSFGLLWFWVLFIGYGVIIGRLFFS